jgi:Ca2+-binding EF-hand superfamily protein
MAGMAVVAVDMRLATLSARLKDIRFWPEDTNEEKSGAAFIVDRKDGFLIASSEGHTVGVTDSCNEPSRIKALHPTATGSDIVPYAAAQIELRYGKFESMNRFIPREHKAGVKKDEKFMVSFETTEPLFVAVPATKSGGLPMTRKTKFKIAAELVGQGGEGACVGAATGIEWVLVVALDRGKFYSFYERQTGSALLFSLFFVAVTVSVAITGLQKILKNHGGTVEEQTQWDDEDEERDEEMKRQAAGISSLDPSSDEFFEIFRTLLHAQVVHTNLQLRIDSEEELDPPDLYKGLSIIVGRRLDRGADGNMPPDVKQLFDKFDANQDGKISENEFYALIRLLDCGATKQQQTALFNALDLDGNGEISYSELLGDPDRFEEKVATLGERRRAVDYILNCHDGRSLLEILHHEKMLDFTRRKLYIWYESYLYNFVICLVMFAHWGVAFWDAPPNSFRPSWNHTSEIELERKQHVNTQVIYTLLISFFLIAVQIFDLCFEIYVYGLRHHHITPDAGGAGIGSMSMGMSGIHHDSETSSDEGEGANLNKKHRKRGASAIGIALAKSEHGCCEMDVIEACCLSGCFGCFCRKDDDDSSPNRRESDEDDILEEGDKARLRLGMLCRIVLLAIVSLDLVCQAATQYKLQDYSDAVSFLPITAIFRPFIMVFRFRGVYDATRNLGKTIFAGKDVLAFFVVVVLIGTTMGVVVLGFIIEKTGKSNNFADVPSAFLETFIFLLTGENYPDMVYAGTDCSVNATEMNTLEGGVVTGGCVRWLQHPIFMFFSFLGMFLVVGLVVAVFDTYYSARMERSETDARKARRMGIIAAFILLDKDQGGDLDKNELLDFLNNTCGLHVKFKMADDLCLSGSEFVELVEEYIHGISPPRAPNCADVTMPVSMMAEFGRGRPGGPELVPKTFADVDAATLLAYLQMYDKKNPDQPAVAPHKIGDKNIGYWRNVGAVIQIRREKAQVAMVRERIRGGEGPPGSQRRGAKLLRQGSQLLDHARKLSRANSRNLTDVHRVRTSLNAGGRGTPRRGSTGLRAPHRQHKTKCSAWCHFIFGSVHRNYGVLSLIVVFCNIFVLSLYSLAADPKEICFGPVKPVSANSTTTAAASSKGVLKDVLNLASQTNGVTDPCVLDLVSILFVVLWWLDVAVRILMTRWIGFWYVNHDFFLEQKNHFDFFLAVLTLAGMLGILLDKAVTTTNAGHAVLLRFVVVLPIWRLISAVGIVREIFFYLTAVLPQYKHVLVLLLVVMYFYNVWGCLMLSGEFRFLSEDAFDMPQANFNSFLDGCVAWA